MNRYYIWDNNLGGIELAQSVKWGYEKEFLVQVEPNGLEAGMKELVEKAQQHGKKQTLEVHCHGHPAALHLGSPYGVTNSNVHSFGNSLKNVMQPGGTIELLACWVAAQGETEAYLLMLKTPIAQITGYRDDYHGVLRREASVKNNSSSAGSSRGLVFQQQNQNSRGLAYMPKPGSAFTPKPEDDGLKFCLTLAQTSGCRVRAGITVQMEDREEREEALGNPVGNWENEIFDFYPGGLIKFAGKSPYRAPKMNIFEMDRLQA